MISFGFIGEGITDQAVIENILIGFFEGSDDEPELRQIQPPPMPAGAKQVPAGGWGPVLQFLRRGEYKEALPNLDYLLIQVDTDVAEDPGFGVPWRENGRALPPVELAARVVAKLVSLMDGDFYTAHADRFIFAIAVHQIECWILPLIYESNKAAKVTGCLGEVNEARRRGNKPPLRRGEHKDYRQYDDASREYRRRRTLMKVHERNPSLALFVRELKAKAGVPDRNGAAEETPPLV